MFEKVEQFNKTIIGIDRKPGPMPEDEVGFWVGTIKEELEEFEDAYRTSDFPAQIDSIIDLLYFGVGALVRMGIPSGVAREIFEAVHEANMTKKKGKKEERDVQHGNDAVKPEGWQSPEQKIMQILDKHFGK